MSLEEPRGLEALALRKPRLKRCPWRSSHDTADRPKSRVGQRHMIHSHGFEIYKETHERRGSQQACQKLRC